MTDSILTSIKKIIGFEDAYTDYDQDLLMWINGALSTLEEVGLILPADFLPIEDKTPTWSNISPDKSLIAKLALYCNLSVKLNFDPPSTSFAIAPMERNKEEQLYRIREYLNKGTQS